MLNVKLAEAFVELYVDSSRYDAKIRSVQAQLRRMKSRVDLTVGANTTAAQAKIDRLTRQLQAAQKLTSFKFSTTGKLPTFGAGVGGLLGGVGNLFTGAGGALGGLGRRIGRGGGRGAGLGFGGGAGGGPGFLTGVTQGLGLPFTGNLAATAGMLTAGSAVGAVKTAAGLQTTFADLRRITGGTAEEMDVLKKTLFDIGTQQAGVTMGDLTEIAGIGGRMGVADREGMAGLATFTRQVAQVKNAITDIPTEELANSMGRVLSLFDLGTDRIAGFGSALTAMDNISTASARDILEITTALSGTAASIGMTLPQVLAFSSALKDAGLSNQLAGSSFSQIFRMMAADSAGFAAKIGVDAQVFKQAYETDVMQALGMVISKFRELATGSGSVASMEFLDSLGFRGVRVAGALTQLEAVVDQVANRTRIASAETETLNALTAASELKAATAEASFTKFQNAVTQLADVIGSALLPGLTDAANLLTVMAKGLSGNAPGFLKKSAQIAFGGMSQEDRNAALAELTEDAARMLGYDVGAGRTDNSIMAARKEALPPANPTPPPPLAPARPATPLPPGSLLRFGVPVPLPASSPLWMNEAQRKLAEQSVMAPERRAAAVGITGAEVGRRLQEDVLNRKDDDAAKTAQNTTDLVKLVNDLIEVAKAGNRPAVGVLAGP